MRIPFTHPSLSDLSAFAARELSPVHHRRTGAHLEQCARCQDALRFMHRINEPASAALAVTDPALLARIENSRAAGVRTILPATQSAMPRPGVRRAWTIAAAALFVFGVSRLFAPSEVSAAADGGVLTFAPAAPLPGSVVRVRYVPAPGAFTDAASIRLRARIRTPLDESYTVPTAHLRALATLDRTRDGAFESRVTVPDSVVYAVLAVESSDSARVDDNAGKGWDLLVSTRDGRPMLAALMQRAEDMMGRSWEEGYASAKRATELYPDSVRGWTHRTFFEQQLLSGAEADSVGAVRTATIDRLVGQAKLAPRISYDDIGSIYYRAYSSMRRPGASRADSTEWEYWWTRIQREYPTHGQRAQRLSLWMDVKHIGATAALDSLERLYALFAPLRGGEGRNLVSRGEAVATQLGDPARLRLWTERSLIGFADSARQIAVFLSAQPPFRTEGMQALRRLLRNEQLNGIVTRPLGRNASAQAKRVADVRRSLLAALGQALVASGDTRAALDTLRLASDGGWEPALFRELARSYALAGDSAGALVMQARLVVDGRTSTSRRDSLVRVGERHVGTERWTTLVSEARREMHAQLLDRSLSRVIASGASVHSRDGKEITLAMLTGNKTALVIFWSRNCGYAIEALPEIRGLIERLAVAGTPVVFVLDESPSAELDSVIASKQISWPVYYDTRTALGNAMRNFGTPHYYVLDAAGRIRFNAVEEIQDLYGRLEAVEAEGVGVR
jgi:hypothetical protein